MGGKIRYFKLTVSMNFLGIPHPPHGQTDKLPGELAIGLLQPDFLFITKLLFKRLFYNSLRLLPFLKNCKTTKMLFIKITLNLGVNNQNKQLKCCLLKGS